MCGTLEEVSLLRKPEAEQPRVALQSSFLLASNLLMMLCRLRATLGQRQVNCMPVRRQRREMPHSSRVLRAFSEWWRCGVAQASDYMTATFFTTP